MEERQPIRKKQRAEKLKEELDAYLMELPVLDFNSGKYDINLIKRYLYPELQKVNTMKFIRKRTSTYTAIKTELFKFLNTTNYLAPEYNYAKFLKAYEVQQKKGFYFPL